MSERFLHFLPDIAVIATIAALTWLYIKALSHHIGENSKSITWLKKNPKIALLVGLPTLFIWAPTVEELIFRAPLIIVFGAMSPYAWIGIVVSNIIFAVIHQGKNSVRKHIEFSTHLSNQEGELATDDYETERAGFIASQPKQTTVAKIFSVIPQFALGMLSGYLGITNQSIWLSVGIHCAWNIFAVIGLPLLIVLVTLVVGGIMLGFSFLINLFKFRSSK
ncbi:MAG: hypothetical protein A3A80_00600 [Candidatus Terrybacteria bacterium RIFCSPLOWO2_01_FULL_44_24]|nr:MAG: hypothetical protein A3B75_02310 [Candidatus Terrybacteria bacterium RIFCSPHIGHO2_02_FULL_43_14]OHA51427.1 MAG: hypothetical protein A3A80_00600 [Candidatus Terrybacteria bacterium RIFCSPLOWO2_01_FULL_44_24]